MRFLMKEFAFEVSICSVIFNIYSVERQDLQIKLPNHIIQDTRYTNAIHRSAIYADCRNSLHKEDMFSQPMFTKIRRFKNYLAHCAL